MDLAAVLARACRMDVVAFKPGNVSLHAPGHGMRAEDFLASARVACTALAEPEARVGARIEAAVTATLQAVGQNTNLGIVLLLAPLARACSRSVAGAAGAGDLAARVATVLADLDIGDTAACFRAIRRARPAGLGRVAAADVHAEPDLDLLAVMRLAAGRDLVARQYANGYADIFARGVPLLVEARRRYRSLAWATTRCYLAFLAGAPDTHIVRKHGQDLAEAVAAQARAVETAVEACENPRRLIPMLEAFDHELKSRGVNPGTSADLTVASVSALLLRERLF